MINSIKNLNWKGWLFTIILIMVASIANEGVTDFVSWGLFVVFIGLPLSLFPLIVGRK